eukprot:CAMPEP_0184655222 /NCGR_PEP_ID=MMETSP0308-20130426/12845_1 /TAXON_ID=38269 /ORGANISM="Gloeochaete witrockiana, Strain SAG 46.84" /LENGTH=49 /DNA_ID=CAMNT_0027091571 /DNA_START=98 /DNA_END=247 /DNA_ORIENTATION=+
MPNPTVEIVFGLVLGTAVASVWKAWHNDMKAKDQEYYRKLYSSMKQQEA